MYNTKHTRKYVALKKNNYVSDYISDVKNEYRNSWEEYLISFFSILYRFFSNKFFYSKFFYSK
jgi:hypothetical protein